MTKPLPKKTLNLTQRRTLAKWLDQLRDPATQQVTGTLRGLVDYGTWGAPDTYGYCCLGVLCEVKGIDLTVNPILPDRLAPKNVKLPEDDYHYTGDPLYPSELISDDLIHAAVLDRWTGLEVLFPQAKSTSLDDQGGSFTEYLTKLNDDGKSFKQIAAIIERRANAIHPGWREGL